MAENERRTSDGLRADIDSGGAGDKVPFSDPASAPLGTDDEAAGTPPTDEQLRRAREAEVTRPDDTSRAMNNRTIPERQGLVISPTMVIASVGVLVVLVVLALII